jgi:hypothetical protein
MRPRPGIQMFALAVPLLVPASAPAASGISDYCATKACWLRRPYALVKCQSDGGRYPAELVRARDVTPAEKSSWDFFPVGHEGIVPLVTLASFDRIAIRSRFAVLECPSSGRMWAIIDLDDKNAKVSYCRSLREVNDRLHASRVGSVGPGDFRTFEEIHAAAKPYKPQNTVPAFAWVILWYVGLQAWFGVVVIAVLLQNTSRSQGPSRGPTSPANSARSAGLTPHPLGPASALGSSPRPGPPPGPFVSGC